MNERSVVIQCDGEGRKEIFWLDQFRKVSLKVVFKVRDMTHEGDIYEKTVGWGEDFEADNSNRQGPWVRKY